MAGRQIDDALSAGKAMVRTDLAPALAARGSRGLARHQLSVSHRDKDGIPDFWEITLNEFPTNFSPNLDRNGDGYTDLEEYMNWLGAPHAEHDAGIHWSARCRDVA